MIHDTLEPTSRLVKMFWARVRKGSPDDCWEWTGAALPAGYGFLTENRKTVYAHRLSYEIHHGPIPDRLMVMHKCDHPPCTNPNHLTAGTAQDNVDDMIAKRRHPHSKPRLAQSPGEALYFQRLLERDLRQ